MRIGGLIVLTTFLWLTAVAFALAAAPSYLLPVSLSLAATAGCGMAVRMLWKRHARRWVEKALLIVPSAVLGVLTADTIDRFVGLLSDHLR